MTQNDSLTARFWAKVAKGDGCWEWTASPKAKYGCFQAEGGKVQPAHRVSWRLAYGQIPTGMWVLHRCDNPRCIRPDHLFLGTVQDNNLDKKNKGRQRNTSGMGHHFYLRGSRLTREQAYEIRASLDTPAVLASRFGVSRSNIYCVLSGKIWRTPSPDKSVFARTKAPVPPAPSILSRFLSKVRKTDTCWEWTGSTEGAGYGMIRGRLDGGQRRTYLAHRLSWLIANGPIPSDMVVRHRCDNRACVRPDHLCLGSKLENTRDMIARGRHVGRVEQRLTAEMAVMIRDDPRPNLTIAVQYGITKSHVSKIKLGINWRKHPTRTPEPAASVPR